MSFDISYPALHIIIIIIRKRGLYFLVRTINVNKIIKFINYHISSHSLMKSVIGTELEAKPG